ncbi:MAG: hypothetical protein B7Z30_06850 [Rhizobiales bacterium 12-68-15]|nr:MAG: hypothetical protein B7Z30_06850 [Rhizobiales bacterium 12-68-15]
MDERAVLVEQDGLEAAHEVSTRWPRNAAAARINTESGDDFNPCLGRSGAGGFPPPAPRFKIVRMRTGTVAPLLSPLVGPARPRSALQSRLWLAALIFAPLLGAQETAAQSGPRPPAPAARKLPRADVPIPPSRPMDLGDPVDEEDVEEEGPAAQAGTPPPAAPPGAAPPRPDRQEALAAGELPPLCAGLVAEKTIVAERAPPIAPKGGCGLPVPVRISAVRLADGNLATLSPPATMRCEMVAAVAAWIREDIGPAVAAMGTRLETVRVADSYSCRPRNRRSGAKISEHGQGNAFDTYGFVLADGRALTVKGRQMPLEFQTVMKASVCARFTTVLGNGSDGYHEDHVHMDLAERRLGIRLCKWKLSEPPTLVAAARPEPKPGAEAASAQGEADAEMAADVPLPPRRPAGLGPRG